jgi:aldehyde:ferredoxin oxidoreductase
MPHSYNQKILHVNLTHGKTWIEEPPESFYRTYGGGSAMAMFYILKEVPPGIDPLAPDNVLTLFVGPSTGVAISGQSRVMANAKSPLTGVIGDAQAGGFWPAELKFAGFDGIVIRGKALQPVYLWIQDGQAELRDATHLWGKLTGEAESALKAELGDNRIQVLQIGPAGEKLDRIACLINMCNRANGRTGMGAVMGSKNLKAVVVRGTHKSKPADAQVITALGRLGKENAQSIPDVRGLGINGTADIVPYQQTTGTLPTRNWNAGQFEGFQQISGETMSATILKERDTCYGCLVRCKRVVETEFGGTAVVPLYGGPEYETVSTMGSYCGVSDLSAVALANQLCNQYGLDTISCGATVAFAMECFENGLITKKDTGGIALKFGNAAAMVRMVELIGKREGFGAILADGSQRAAKKIGKNASDYLITVKGEEAPAHMAHAKKSLSIIYAVNPFGADHQSHEHDPTYEDGAPPLYLKRMAMIGLDKPQPPGSLNEEKVRLTYVTQLFFSALDSYGLCQFVWGPSWELYGPDDMIEMLRAATGWDITLDEFMKVGERRLNMMRAFNAREGIDRRADILPKKLSKPLQGTGPTAGISFDPKENEHWRELYYKMAGWDVKSGNPTQAKLDSLGLDWVRL